MAQDLIQIVDENDNPVGTATREDAQKQGLFHRIAKVNVEDSEGRILLQKRGPYVKLFANCWDNSAAGHVDAGEDFETAALRELAEELGVENATLKEVSYYKKERVIDGKKLNRFTKVFKTVVPSDYPFKLQLEEVGEVRWFTGEEIVNLIHEHPEMVTDGLRDLAKSLG